MDRTGERIDVDPSANRLDGLYLQHYLRYQLALKFVEGKRVVDVACGSGYGSYLLAKKAKEVLGIDISEEAIKNAKLRFKKPNLTFFASDAAKTYSRQLAGHDIAVSFETIEHIEDQVGFLSRIQELLRPRGTLIISTPHRENYRRAFYGGQPGNPFHVKELSRQEFVTLLEQKFEVCQTYGQLPLESVVQASSIAGRGSDRSMLRLAIKKYLLKNDSMLLWYVRSRKRFAIHMPMRDYPLDECVYMITVCHSRI